MQNNIQRQAMRIAARALDLRQYLWRRSQEPLRKHEIINALLKKYGYRSYLEIATPTTGARFTRIHKRRLEVCHRLMYQLPEDFDDGEAITFRSGSEAIEHLIEPRPQYDAVFLDSWHSYDCSIRDLSLAFSLLHPGGMLITHDCVPPVKAMSSPDFLSGGWFGVSYCAYVDFLLDNPSLEHYTVDADYGCGVIRKNPKTLGWKPRHDRSVVAIEHWRRERSRNADMFDIFHAYKRELVNLISAEEFLALEEVNAPLNLRLDRILPQLAQAPF